MGQFRIKKFSELLRKNLGFIVACVFWGTFAGFLYSAFLFKPLYKATAILVVKDDLLLTAKELVLSNQNIIKLLKKDNSAGNLNKKIALYKKNISVKNPKNTNLIEISAVSALPEEAKNIAEESALLFMQSYFDERGQDFLKINNALNKKIQNAKKNLKNVQNNINNLQKSGSVVDVELELKTIENRLNKLADDYIDLKRAEESELYKINSLVKNIDVEWKSILDAVVLGHNKSIPVLQQRLSLLKEEFASASTRFGDKNSLVIDLKARILSLQKQIQEQISSTVDSFEDSNKIINDPLRTEIIKSLIFGEAHYESIKAQRNFISNQISLLNRKKAKLPAQKAEFDSLKIQEKKWKGIIAKLEEKQSELELHELSAVNNIKVVDFPIVPPFSEFPNKTHVVLIFSCLSFLFSIIFSIFSSQTKEQLDDVEQIETDLNLPVLGTVPWLDKEIYEEPNMVYALDESASFYSLSYQKIVSNIRIKGDYQKAKVLAFTSSEFSKYRSSIIVNTAYGLTKTGQSVVVLDADFRTPSVNKEFDFEVSDKYNLSALLKQISQLLQVESSFCLENYSHYINTISKSDKFHVIANCGNVSEPCEYLHSKAFKYLIEELKKKYDWVLIDVPPILAVPDATVVGSYSDGVILAAGMDLNKSRLLKIKNQLNRFNVNLLGIIAREFDTKDHKPANEYIKQIISRMIPYNEILF